jgi:hypothetical protein
LNLWRDIDLDSASRASEARVVFADQCKMAWNNANGRRRRLTASALELPNSLQFAMACVY